MNRFRHGGLVPAIRVFLSRCCKDVDARKAGHDEKSNFYFLTLLASILIEVSSSFVENALSTANGFSMPR